MTKNTPGLVLFSQEQKKERALPKGCQSVTAQDMMMNMFDGLNRALKMDKPELHQPSRRVVIA